MPSSGGEKEVRVLSKMVGVTAASVGGGADRGGRDQMRALDKGLRKTSLPINRLETNFWPLPESCFSQCVFQSIVDAISADRGRCFSVIVDDGGRLVGAKIANEHTLDHLRTLRLNGMVRAIEDQASKTAVTALSFDDRLTLLVQREVAWRDDGRVAWLLKAARPKVSAACVEDIDWRASRGLDRGLVVTLTGGDWLRHPAIC